MEKYIKIAQKKDIADGKMKEYQVEGKTLVLANIDGEYLAFDSVCTHAQCALAGGYLSDYTLTCYCHGAQFDISTGEVLAPPATNPLRTYKVKTEGEDILVHV